MRCTECGKYVKPVVAIDIDGTLGDYQGHFLEFVSSYLGYKYMVRDYDGSEGFRQWVTRTYKLEPGQWRDMKLAYRQGAQKRSMPMYAGADRLTKEVRANGAELWLTTTRPFLRLDNVDPDTRWWLENRGIEYDYLIADDRKYQRLASLVDRERVVAVVDDLEDEWAVAAQEFGYKVPILRRTQYNSAVRVGAKEGAETIAGVGLLVNERLEAWQR